MSYKKELKRIGKTTKYSCWQLDMEVAHFLLPRIKILKKGKQGVPVQFFDEHDTEQFFDEHDTADSDKSYKRAKKRFHKVLDEIIEGLKIQVKEGGFESLDKYSEKYEKFRKSMELFAKYIDGFWT